MSEYEPGFTPSIRQRVWRLVENHARTTGQSQRKIWGLLYKKFEERTGKRWRQIANMAETNVLSTIVGEGRGQELLEFARELIGTEVRR